VEPLDDWSKGAIQLVEIPTDSEYVDNIVAYFKPAAKPRVGSSINVSYRLHWNAERILPLGLAQVTAVRTTKQWPVEQKVAEAAPVTNAAPNARTIMIEFKGDLLGQLGAARLKPVVEGAMFDHAVDLVGDPDGDPNHLRLIFNVGGTDRNPTEIRAFLLGPRWTGNSHGINSNLALIVRVGQRQDVRQSALRLAATTLQTSLHELCCSLFAFFCGIVDLIAMTAPTARAFKVAYTLDRWSKGLMCITILSLPGAS
jgi:hypothetical protein